MMFGKTISQRPSTKMGIMSLPWKVHSIDTSIKIYSSSGEKGQNQGKNILLITNILSIPKEILLYSSAKRNILANQFASSSICQTAINNLLGLYICLANSSKVTSGIKLNIIYIKGRQQTLKSWIIKTCYNTLISTIARRNRKIY